MYGHAAVGSESRSNGQRTQVRREHRGTIHEWPRDTITVPEIRALGGIPNGTAVEEIDLDTNVQRTLAEDEIVRLKPGLGFAKKIAFRRGDV